MMARRLLLSILACAGRPALALVLQDDANPNPFAFLFPFTTSPPDQAYPPKAKLVKVLVFGDRYGDIGFGTGILETMFHEKHILADVRHIQRSMVGACSMANEPPVGHSLLSGIKQAFGKEQPDYVWYLGGALDLMNLHKYQHPVECRLAPVDTNKCIKASITEDANYCTDTMLKTMWKEYPNTTVVQSGYDLPCTEGLGCAGAAAVAASRDPLCKADPNKEECGRKNLATFHEYLLGSEYHNLTGFEDKFATVDILGAMQSAYPEKYPGAEPGKPDFTKGSPCSDTLMCFWPLKGSKGYKAIAQAFWSQYFSKDEETLTAKFGKFSQMPEEESTDEASADASSGAADPAAEDVDEGLLDG